MKLKKKDIKALKRIKKICKKCYSCKDCPLVDEGYCFFRFNSPCDLRIKQLTND